MPELPEVETTCKGIAPEIIDQRILQIDVRHPMLRRPVPKELNKVCAGQNICSVTRRGKYILIHLENGTLIIHLGMSGHLRIVPSAIPAEKHDHIDLLLASNHILRYTDPRRFGLWEYCSANALEHPLLSSLGPEPLESAFDGRYLWELSRKYRVAVKNFVMNNKIVVGVGNIYANESLFEAGIHPGRPATSLSEQECHQLCTAIKQVLQKAIKAGGTTLKDFLNPNGKPGYFRQTLKVYGQTHKPCQQCQSLIQSLIIGGRNTFFCLDCQI